MFLFAVPFDEDQREADVWFLDHDYLENMYGMFKKVNGMFFVLIMFIKLVNLSLRHCLCRGWLR